MIEDLNLHFQEKLQIKSGIKRNEHTDIMEKVHIPEKVYFVYLCVFVCIFIIIFIYLHVCIHTNTYVLYRYLYSFIVLDYVIMICILVFPQNSFVETLTPSGDIKLVRPLGGN